MKVLFENERYLKAFRVLVYSLLPSLIILSFVGMGSLIKSVSFLLFGIWSCSLGCTFFGKIYQEVSVLKKAINSLLGSVLLLSGLMSLLALIINSVSF